MIISNYYDVNIIYVVNKILIIDTNYKLLSSDIVDRVRVGVFSIIKKTKLFPIVIVQTEVFRFNFTDKLPPFLLRDNYVSCRSFRRK